MAKITISFPDGFLKRVDRTAKAQGRSRSELIREALRGMLITVREPKRFASESTPGRRQREQPEAREHASQGLVARPELETAPCHPLQQLLEWWHEVCLVENDQGVGTQETGVIRAHLPGHSVAFEEEPRTDHVHGPDDDGGRGRILQPFAVVDVLAAERRDGERALTVQTEPLLEVRVGIDQIAEASGHLCGLVHDRATIHDVDEPPGKFSATRARRARLP